MLIECSCAKSSEISNSDHSIIDDQADMIHKEAEYNSLISQYNSAVDAYNAEAHRINVFIDKLSDCNIGNLPDHITEQSKNTQSFDQYMKNEKAYSKLDEDVKQLIELTAGMKKIR